MNRAEIILRRIAHAVLPERFRAYLLSIHREIALRKALRKLRENPEACLNPTSRVIADLIYGWGNEGWSASDEYLRGCLNEALALEGTILECGSGLTTLAVAVIADRAGHSVYSLEHIEAWGERVRNLAARLRIRNVHIVAAPLRDYGEYSWYSPPPELLQRKFSLVLCDGPPGDTPGGRYGLNPTVRDSLDNRCIILLDDAIRQEEQETAQRWQKEMRLRCQKVGDAAPYFRLTMGDAIQVIAE